MAEYIDRVPALEGVRLEEDRAHQFRCPMGADAASFRAGMLTAFGVANSIINRQKVAHVAPVRHGRWVDWDVGQGIDIWHKCSECGDGEELISNFCPNCGAKMDGGADSD